MVKATSTWTPTPASTMIAFALMSLLAVASAAPQYAAPKTAPAFAPAYSPPVPPPAPQYAPAPAIPAPAPVYAAPAPAPVYAAPAPVPKITYGPPAATYGVPNREGGELLSEFAPAPKQPSSAPAPFAPAPAPFAPAPAPTPFAPAPAPAPVAPSVNYGTPNTEGGDLLSENVAIPQGTRVELHDKSNQYSHGFSDDKGTEVAEQGRLITTNGGWEYVVAKTGSYKYISPEGKTISVRYTADENGYHPTIETSD